MFKKVLIAGDNHGDKLANEVQIYLSKMGISATILERDAGESYAQITKKAVKIYETEPSFDAMVLICGTGVGVCMVANRYSFVRAVLAENSQTAYFARRHENANCLCLAGGYSDLKQEVKSAENINEILEAFFKTEFEGGRHKNRIDMLAKIGE